MQNKTKILLVAGGIVLVISLIVTVFLNKFSPSVDLVRNPQPSQMKDPLPNEALQPIGKEPKQIMGIVETISGNVLTLKQLNPVESRYEINREEIGSYMILAENDSFDEAKYQEMIREMPGLSDEKIDPTNEMTDVKNEANTKKMEGIQNKIIADPSLKAFSEQESDWSQIVKGGELMVEVDSSGKKITILPAGFLEQINGE